MFLLVFKLGLNPNHHSGIFYLLSFIIGIKVRQQVTRLNSRNSQMKCITFLKERNLLGFAQTPCNEAKSLFLGIDAKKFALSSPWRWTWESVKKPSLFGLLLYTLCVNKNGSWDEVRKPSRFCASCQDLLWAHQPKAGSVRAVSRHPKWPSPRPWLLEEFLHLMMI